VWASETGPFLGYTPKASALDVAIADDEHPELLAAIQPHVSAGALADAYLRSAIETIGSWSTDEEQVDRFAAKLDRAGALDRAVTKLGSCDTGALIHFLCDAEARTEYFARAIDRLDVNLALPGPGARDEPTKISGEN
jgi:hypothetical protein